MAVNSFLVRFLESRWRWLVLLLLGCLLAVSTIGLWQLRIESDIDKLLRTPDPVLAQFKRDFRIADEDVFVILEGQRELLDPAVLERLRVIQQRVAALEGVQETVSLYSLRSKRRAGRYFLPLLTSRALSEQRWPATRDAILAHPLAVGQLLSEDLRATLIIVRLRDSYETISRTLPLVEEMKDAAREELAKADPAFGLRAIVTGFPVLHAEMYVLMKQDQRIFMTGGIAVGAIIGWWLFRNLLAVVAVGAGPILGAMVTWGLSGAFDIPITVLNSIMPVIVVIVGYADSVHLLLEIRTNIAHGAPGAVAIAEAMRRLWLPCLLTSLTTAIGFGSLIISDVGAVREFGALTAIGCLINFFTVQLSLPILVSFGTQRIANAEVSERDEKFRGISRLLATIVPRWSSWIALVGCLLVGTSAILCLWLRSENRLSDSVPIESRTFQSYLVMEDKFAGAGALYVLIEWNDALSINSPQVLGKTVEVTDVLAAEPQLGAPLSILDLLASLPGETTEAQGYRQQFAQLRHIPSAYLGTFVNPGRRQTVVASRVKDIGAGSLIAIVERLEKRLAANELAGVTTAIVGPTVTMSRTFLQLIRDLAGSLLLATVLIFALMTVLFRSFSLGLISILPNALALLGSAACLVLMDQPLQFVSVLCFTVCLGISVDDTIHFLMRYLWHRREGETGTDATVHSMREIGPALMVTTCVFVSGNAVVLLSYIPALRMYAWLSCASLTLALVGDIVFLPAFILWLTKKHPESAGTR